MTVSDKDLFSATELMKLRFKDTFGAKEVIGRALVPLKAVTEQEPQPYTHWSHLGEGSWGDDGGCVSGSDGSLIIPVEGDAFVHRVVTEAPSVHSFHTHRARDAAASS